MNPLLTSREVCELLQVSVATLSRWRDNGKGPIWIDLEGMPRYAEVDVRLWAEERRRT